MNEQIYHDALKHVLCGALIHLDALRSEMHKLNIQPENNDPEMMKRATILNMMITAINDIIHPAHDLLGEYFKDSGDYFALLRKAFLQAKEMGLTFVGCGCEFCKSVSNEQLEKK